MNYVFNNSMKKKNDLKRNIYLLKSKLNEKVSFIKRNGETRMGDRKEAIYIKNSNVRNEIQKFK